MVKRRYKIKNHFEELEEYLKDSVLSGEAKELIEIGGKPIKLPKKKRKEAKEAYFRFPERFKQAK